MEANALQAKAETTKVEAQLGNGSPSEQFTWAIDNFSKLNVKGLYSDVFHVGGYKWRILVFPRGNNVDYLSVYLAVADSLTLPHGWSIYAMFSLSVINQLDPKYTVARAFEHEFKAGERNWGFPSFVALGELIDSTKGFLVNDTCIVKAEVTLKKEQDENELKIEEKEVPVESQPEPKSIDSQTIIPDAHLSELPTTPENLIHEQITQVAVPSDVNGENLMSKANTYAQAITAASLLIESLQQTQQVTLMTKDVQEEAKTTSIPLAPLIVDPPTVQLPQPTVVEDEISPFYLSELDALFGDIKNLLAGKSSNSNTLSSSCPPRACSEEEISHAKNIFKECLNMKLARVIEEGRETELKNSLSIMITGNACPDHIVSFTTKFVDNLEQYAGARQDLREVQDKEKSIDDELETTAKQLASEFMPLRNQAEAVDQEIAELERQLSEKKAKKVWLKKSLEDLVDRATTSKQALIDAQEVISLLRNKKKQVEKMVSEMEWSWEILKSSIP
ncbi:uncharacterized protein LOC133797701 isoform X2 [Humulus lupulus]|uniref:uncharacterized protein LOC133797701 isoform X2 n=1 Tax=Humulus lupulus TaxID=3486 RepID=UPI002B417431|nr:uncharacterized protein LOC133797701 isoform X2 [Humulus lupulus]